jgi:membrane associated rhomboid family serine protease
MLSITVILIVITCIVSFYAWSNADVLSKWILNPYKAAHQQQYWRLFSSGFVHADYGHLFFNMFSLWFMGEFLNERFQETFGGNATIYYLLLYFSGIVVANIPDFREKKDNPNYNSLGASGGVSAIVFAAVLLEPMMRLSLYGIIPLSGVVFGILYAGYSVYMAYRGTDNINHKAHLWGAMWGIAFVAVTYPPAIREFFEKISQGF